MTYVMSDIHGFYDRYKKMLELISFTDQDTLIINGDVADRGPDGIKIFQDIMSRKNAILIMGNHEKMFIDTVLACSKEEMEEAASLWFFNGGEATWNDYAELELDERRKLMGFLMRLDTEYETTIGGQKFYIVHGFPGNTMEERVWERPNINSNSRLIPEGAQLIIGHSPVFMFHGYFDSDRVDYLEELRSKGEHMKIEHAKHFIDIDCGCGQNIYGISKLACLRLDDMQEFYV